MSEFRMPSLGADMAAGTLVEWMKRPGDRVERGEVIAAVETQKGAIEIECFESGTLDRLLVEVGQRVPVGTPLAIIRGEGEAETAPAVMEAAQPVAPAEAEPAKIVMPPPPPPPPALAPAPRPAATAGGVRFSPVALRRAQQLGLDLARIAPGPDGIVGLREVDAASAATTAPVAAEAPPRAAGAGIDLDEMRKAIAAAMVRSWREIPHYTVASTLDLEPLLGWLEAHNATRPVPERLHYAAPLIKAVALALKAVPALNGHYGEGGFAPSASVHLGIAIAMRGGGLIAPAILDADTLDLPTLMARLEDLVARVRGGRLRSREMSAATATLTNLGERTADSVQPVIYPPQVAIVGCGQVVERAVASGHAIGARRGMTVTVAGDHRVSDGRAAAKFLVRLEALLHAPERL